MRSTAVLISAPSALIDITVRRNGYGRQRDSFETDLEVAGLDASVPRVSSSARRSSSGRATRSRSTLRSMAIPCCADRDRSSVAAFHPELSGDSRIHERFLQEV